MPNFPEPVVRTRRISEANTAMTVSSEPVTRDVRTKLAVVYVAYSATVSLDVTVTINQGIAAGYDTLVGTITLGVERYGVYLPERPLPLAVGDVIDVLAPAGGAGVTSAVQILFDSEYPVQAGEGGYQYEQVARE